jgi:3-oxoadipate enol-lactonase
VLLDGIGCDGFVWRRLLPSWAKRRRIVRLHLRGHGGSGVPRGYRHLAIEDLADDVARVLEAAGIERAVVAGHSMGCHTAVAHALDHADEVAALVLAGPVTLGLPAPEEVLARWDRLAAGLERGGVDGFMEAYEADLSASPDRAQTALRITRERMERHRRPKAVARALREVSRSLPFDGLGELETLGVPALVVASHDEADPGHPYAIAEAWAERLPAARLVSEERGESPLAWQGGRLSREIASFCAGPEVAERLAAD